MGTRTSAPISTIVDNAGARASPDLNLYTAIPLLIREGYLSAFDVLGGVSAEDLSRRNRSVILRTPRGGFHLKQSDPMASGGARERDARRADLRRESEILHAFRTVPSFRSVRSHLPEHCGFIEEPGVLVSRLVHPAVSVTKLHRNGGKVALETDVAQAAGDTVGRCHRASIGLRETCPAQEPLAHAKSVLRQVSPLRPEVAALRDAARGLLAAQGVDALPERPDLPADEGALIHGDARWDNYLVTVGGGPDRLLPVVMIDWELASWGDPAYDVGAWMAEYARFFAVEFRHKGPAGVPESMDREGVAASSVVRSCQAFVDAYCSAARVAGQARADLVRRAKAHLPHLVLLAALEAARPLSSPIGEKWVFRELATQAGRHAAGGSWSEGIR